ncbi:MAG: ABC transporter permease [Chloroflexia bacterium]|nr:ABC transporter permease [Chloroflexia bacterium]
MDDELIRWRWVRNNLGDEILPALWEHIVLCGVSVFIALVIAIPIGIYVTRHRSLYTPVTFITGVLYTVPSLSFFAMLISVGLPIGRAPAIIALVAYSLLVLIRNVVVGIDSVPRETLEAARGMGLTSGQILRQVELPLALPIIVAGIRIATVTTIGVATIAAYIAAGGLGDLIFRGIDRDFPTQIIVGAALATLLSIIADFGLLAVERQLRPWSRRRAARAA